MAESFFGPICYSQICIRLNLYFLAAMVMSAALSIDLALTCRGNVFSTTLPSFIYTAMPTTGHCVSYSWSIAQLKNTNTCILLTLTLVSGIIQQKPTCLRQCDLVPHAPTSIGKVKNWYIFLCIYSLGWIKNKLRTKTLC